jgi:hypothetical protein
MGELKINMKEAIVLLLGAIHESSKNDQKIVIEIKNQCS